MTGEREPVMRPDGDGGGPGVGRPDPPDRIDLAAVRRRLATVHGQELWRSLEELAGTPAFEELLHREFPRQAAIWPEGVDRRRFLQLMGASLALGGLTACTRQPLEQIVPYVEQPEQIVPGRPLYFATGMSLDGIALGVLAESHLGRPTKIEGNPEHPASLGATDLFAQASVLGLYDPDRSAVVTRLGRIHTWADFRDEIRPALLAQRALEGQGLRLLTETVTSPTLAHEIRALLAEVPRARWHQYDPAAPHGARAGALAALGRPVATRYDLTRARVVLCLDADLLAAGPGSVRYAHDFMIRRRVGAAPSGEAATAAAAEMNRLYVVESSPTMTASLADHRLALSPRRLVAFTRALAAELIPGGPAPGAGGEAAPGLPDLPDLDSEARIWIRAVARDLEAHRGAGVVAPGPYAPSEVHALAHRLNRALGNVGATVLYGEPVEAEPTDQIASLAELTAAMGDGEVDLLLVLGGNPVYNAPADLGFTAALTRVPLRVHLSLYDDETSQYCQWHLPEAHYLEAWADARAFDGTVTLAQPLIEPLYGGRSVLEVVAGLTGDGDRPGRDLVRAYWQARGLGGGDFETAWRRALHDGLIREEELPAGPPPGGTASAAAVTAAARLAAAPEVTGRETLAAGSGDDEVAASLTDPPDGETLELVLRPDPTVHDGRFANNGWLQECPKPLSLLTWDNAALVSPATAERLGLANEELVELAGGGAAVEAPVWILPGVPEGTVTLHLGYGRTRAGRVAEGTGFDAYPLFRTSTLWTVPAVTVRRTGRRYPLASTQQHFALPLVSAEAERRHLVRVGTLAEFHEDPHFAERLGHAPAPEETLYPPFVYEGHAWGMGIDLSACTGCSACVVACQSENTIPTVGKDQVLRGREMHWLRIDRYYAGDLDHPEVHHQPVPCMHCENAPCELVCPVAATSHSSEGLNDMIYNRCVGTRYCSNNCPYKVRRFNFLYYNGNEYNDAGEHPVLALGRNPDVTVRTRGVMEKCTYCVQRINAARTDARAEGRPIRDGEIVTACQQACPTRAIVFGDVNDPGSRVSSWKAQPLNYGILEDLNTRPRTTYLAKLRNPNPELARRRPPEAH